MSRRSGVVLLLTAALAALATVALVATPASAHNVVIATTPSAGETLTELPERFSIVTNEPLLALDGGKGFVLRIRDAAGAYYGDGCVRIVDATMSATPALGAPGDYTVLWQAVSADGHTIDGEIPFSWQPSGDVTPSEGFAEPPVCGEEPGATATSPATPEPGPTAEGPTASGVDLATVLWIGGALLAVGVAVAVAIALAGRRKP
jgi:methionine-rich copper-binding protein CopC